MIKRAALIVLMSISAMACKQGPASPVYSTGEFRVTGSAGVTHADIRYRAFGGAGDVFLSNVALTTPWSRSFDVVQSGDTYFLAAQSNDKAADSLTVEVFFAGNPVPIDSEFTNLPFGYVAVYGAVP